jgi:hypothetical protein
MGKPPPAPKLPTESPSHPHLMMRHQIRPGGPIYWSIHVGFQSLDAVYWVAHHLGTFSAYRPLTIEIGSNIDLPVHPQGNNVFLVIFILSQPKLGFQQLYFVYSMVHFVVDYINTMFCVSSYRWETIHKRMRFGSMWRTSTPDLFASIVSAQRRVVVRHVSRNTWSTEGTM